MNMNSKDRYSGENTKKKKTQNIQITKPSNTTHSYYLVNKPDLDKSDKIQKSARSTKVDPNAKNTLKSEKIFKTLNTPNQVKPFQIDQPPIKQYAMQIAQKNTRDNQQILAELESNFSKYENFDLDKGVKRWSDLPVKPSYGLNGNKSTISNVNLSRPKLDHHHYMQQQQQQQTLENDFENNVEKTRGHVRNYSTSKITPYNESIVQPSSTRSNNNNNNTRGISKNMKSNNSISSNVPIQNNYIDKNQMIYPFNYQGSNQLNKKISQKKDEYENDNRENIAPRDNIYYKANNTFNQPNQICQIMHEEVDEDNLIIEEIKDQECNYGMKSAGAPIKSKESVLGYNSNKMQQEEITTSIANPNALTINTQLNVNNNSLIQQTYIPSSLRGAGGMNTAAITSHIGYQYHSHYTNGSNSNTNTSALSSYNKNDKKSTGKCISNTNSNNNSNIKNTTTATITNIATTIFKSGNGIQKYSDQKTESTYISGGDSPSALLDCDETISHNVNSNNNTNSNNNNTSKNDPYVWIEKFDIEINKPIMIKNLEGMNFNNKMNGSNANTNTNREVLKDITDTICKIDQFIDPCTLSPLRNVDEELKEFDKQNNSFAIDTETISYLIMREPDYTPDPHYFDKKQSNITWIMRAILFDWMMEVCMEFTLKRETYHYAINFVDRYLSNVPAIQKCELQLIGVTAMYIAAKMEEIYAPKVVDFAKSADNGYSTQQIMDMEQKMLKALRWLLTPTSLNTWGSWYMNQWDLYVEHSPYAINHPLILSSIGGIIQFKQPNEKSYARFREIMQLIDCSTLEVQTLQYKQRPLIASFMYLVLGKHYKQFTVQQITEEFPKSSLYLLDNEYAFNDLFEDFLSYSFGFQLVDLLPTIQYASTYFKLSLNFDLPTAAKINKENVLEGHFEEFLAYQTHHPLIVDFIKKRPRTIL